VIDSWIVKVQWKKKLQFSYKLMSVNCWVSYLIVRFEARYVQDVTISHQVLPFSCSSNVVICMYIVKYFPLTLRYAGYADKHNPSQCRNFRICWNMRFISKIQKHVKKKNCSHIVTVLRNYQYFCLWMNDYKPVGRGTPGVFERHCE